MRPAEQLRAFSNALKYIDTQMTPSDLMAIMAYQGGAVRVKQDFTDDRGSAARGHREADVRRRPDGDGIRDKPDGGTPFGQDDAEFNIFNTDRQLAALQTAVTMLRPLPEQKALIYFAQRPAPERHRQPGAAARHDQRGGARQRHDQPDRRARPGGARRRSATRPARRPAARHVHRPDGVHDETGFQRSQDTLYALAKDTGGKAMLDYNDLSVGIVQAAQAVTSYYIIGYYSANTATDGKFRRVRVTLANDSDGRAGLPAGLLRRQGVRQLHRRRQGAAARGSADAREPDHRDHDRHGGELLPVEPRRVLRAGRREDSRQRAGACAAPRRATHGDRLHRRRQGRVRHHRAEHPRQARYQADRRHRRRSWRRGRSSTTPASRCCRAST